MLKRFVSLTHPSLMSTSVFSAVAAFALSSTLFACVIDNSPPRRLDDSTDTGGTGGTSTATPSPSGSSSTTGPASPAPMLVVVDTDQVLKADPGQGVGIFTEYATGGKWHIWWTCDTTLSNQQCDVVLSATAASGTITNLDSSELQNSGLVTATSPSRVDVQVTTTTQVHGITFTTNPGEVITLEATVGGLREGPGANHSFFFFVQDGKINGGYTGSLTNPLQLEGKTP
jgi:hypothetical protein